MSSYALDLTNAYYLHLEAEGCRHKTVRVRYVDDAQAIFNDWRDHNGFGASELRSRAGLITDQNNQTICRISYNGRAWLPDGKPLDGMTDEQWVRFCTEGKELHIDLCR